MMFRGMLRRGARGFWGFEYFFQVCCCGGGRGVYNNSLLGGEG